MKTTPVTVRLKERVWNLVDQIAEALGLERATIVREAIEERVDNLHVILPGTSLNAVIQQIRAASSSTRTVLLSRLKNGLKLGEYSIDGDGSVSPLILAARGQSDVEVVRLLLDAGADTDAVDSCGNTALVVAIADQGKGHDDNLSVIDLLLARGASPFVRPPLMAGMDVYGWAEEWEMAGTMRVIRNHAMEITIDRFFQKSPPSLMAHELLKSVGRFRYIQGVPWPKIFDEIKTLSIKYNISGELGSSTGSTPDQVAAFVLRELGAWSRIVKEGIKNGTPDKIIIQELRHLRAMWLDVASAFSKLGRTPESTMELVFKEMNKEEKSIGQLSLIIRGSYYHFQGPLNKLREWMEVNDISMEEVVKSGWEDAKSQEGLWRRFGISEIREPTHENPK